MAPFFKKHNEADKVGKDKTNTRKAHTDEKDKGTAADSIPTSSDGGKREPLLDDEDEQFLERLVSNSDDDDGPPPPLPPRPKTPDLTWDSDSESFRLANTECTTEQPVPPPLGASMVTPKKKNRLSQLFRRKPSSTSNTLTVPFATTTVPAEEADREWADLNRVLSRLGLGIETTTDSSSSKKSDSKIRSAALTASAEVQSLLRQFVVVLKDIMHGAPTAVDDLVRLLDGRNDALKRGFEKLPDSMQRLVTQLPKKLTSSLGPEVLAAAAEAHGLKKDPNEGLAKFLTPKNLGDLVMTPAIVKSMLKAIVNALKMRWPAFVGTNVLWSAAVFLLLFVLWYCHKRGKEEREKREKEEAEGKDAVVDDVEAEGLSTAVVVVESPVERPRT
ncbi:hypothetical protein VTI74DRAFT_1798 [Chaetomium olivicolor]